MTDLQTQVHAYLERTSLPVDVDKLIGDLTNAEHDVPVAATLHRGEDVVLIEKEPGGREDKATREPGPRVRKRFVLVAAALLVLLAVPAIAMLIDWDTPPLDQEFPAGPIGPVVYGAEAGIGEYCAWRMDFEAGGVPVMAGPCGVLRLEGEDWRVVNAEVGSGSLMDIAIAPDGTVWLADIDGPVKSVVGAVVTNHPVRASRVEVTQDGTVWARRYDPPNLPALMSFDGTAFVAHDVGPVDELMAAADGSLRTLALDRVEYDPETQTATEWPLLLGRMDNGTYTTEPVPEGVGREYLTLAADGTLWAIGETGRVIEREKVSDSEWALTRYDGSELVTVAIPFAEPNDVAVHPDGTVWVSSSLYGAFAYDGLEWRRYGVSEGLPSEEVTFVEIGPDGSVYIGTRLGVARVVPDNR